MDDILSEGRKIESRLQLEKLAIALRSKREVEKFGNEARAPARKRPLTRERARSNWTRSEALKRHHEKETRFEGCGLKKERGEK